MKGTLLAMSVQFVPACWCVWTHYQCTACTHVQLILILHCQVLLTPSTTTTYMVLLALVPVVDTLYNNNPGVSVVAVLYASDTPSLQPKSERITW